MKIANDGFRSSRHRGCAPRRVAVRLKSQQRFRVFAPLLLLASLAACGQQQGACEINGVCQRQQQNTCESGGGTWHEFTLDDKHMQVQKTCGDVGYKQPIGSDRYGKSQ